LIVSLLLSLAGRLAASPQLFLDSPEGILAAASRRERCGSEAEGVRQKMEDGKREAEGVIRTNAGWWGLVTHHSSL